MSAKFEAGKTYEVSWCTGDGDNFGVDTCTIISRTAKTVVIERNGKKQRKKIYTSAEGERIYPTGIYSMCPVCCAEDIIEDEAPEITEAPNVVSKQPTEAIIPEIVNGYPPVKSFVAAPVPVSFLQQQVRAFFIGLFLILLSWRSLRNPEKPLELPEAKPITRIRWYTDNPKVDGVHYFINEKKQICFTFDW